MRTKARRCTVRSSKSALLETLESRLVMSTLHGAPVEFAFAGSQAAPITVTAVDNDTQVPAAAYSNIAHSRLETRAGGQDIGYVAKSGAFVEYTLNVAVAGIYTLNINVASAGPAAFNVSDNGQRIASASANTGGWDAIATVSETVTLSAGVQRLRFSSANHTQYNLSGFELALQPPAVVTVPSTTTTDGNVTISSTPTTTDTPVAGPVLNPILPTATDTTFPAPVSTTSTTAISPGKIVVSSTDSAVIPTAASVTQRTLTSFTELDVTDITADSTILVSEAGNTFTIIANGIPQQVTGNFGDLMVYGGAGNATLIVDSSVTIPATVYSGAGHDFLTNQTSAQATIVTLDGGADVLTGNGVNTAFWADPSDTLNATAAEKANGGVHVISSMYQPVTTTVGAAGYVTAVRDGAHLADPTSSQTSTVTRLASNSFWGAGPVLTDINQGQASDCYFLTTLDSLAQFEPGKLLQMGVDLGDGTYVIQFQRAGKTSFVRVDGDLPAGGPYANGLLYQHPGATGDQWASIFEKAYAFFRTGVNTYDSLDNGFPSNVYNDLGVADGLYMLPADQNSFYATAAAKLAANKPVDILTNAVINNAPLIESHTYTVLSISQDNSGTVWLTVRNPWGVDGVNWDSNPNDGVLVVSYAMIKANCTYGCVVT